MHRPNPACKATWLTPEASSAVISNASYANQFVAHKMMGREERGLLNVSLVKSVQ
jgi:hypothetical protein